MSIIPFLDTIIQILFYLSMSLLKFLTYVLIFHSAHSPLFSQACFIFLHFFLLIIIPPLSYLLLALLALFWRRERRTVGSL